MDDTWERVVEAALERGNRTSELRVLNLDGSVKSVHGFLPPAGILERFPSLEQLSIANVGVLSLEKFPRLRNLQRLVLSDNRIASGLENLVQAGLHSLRDLDLSNNRIQYIEDLAPLANLHLVSLDLYECPVTKVSDYRSKVFSMIRGLKYLDKLDANGDERSESDYEEDEEEDYEYDEFDPGNGEVDSDDRDERVACSCGDFEDVDDVIVDADEDEQSDTDEEETETSGRGSENGFSIRSGRRFRNGFRMENVGVISGEDVEVIDADDDFGEEIDEEEGEDRDAVDVIEVFDSDEDDLDVVEDVEDDEGDIDEEEDEDSEEDEEETDPGCSGRLDRFEEEIDGHEHGEEDENGDIGEEVELMIDDRDIEDDFTEDEGDLVGDYLVQPIARPNGSSEQSCFKIDDEEYFDPKDDNQEGDAPQTIFYNSKKRRRDEEGELGDDDDNTMLELRLSKRR